MRARSILPAALAAAFFLSSTAAAQDAGDERPGVGVFPFIDGGSFGPDREDYAALAVGLQQLLLVELSQSSGLRIVERSLLREIMDEMELARDGWVDPRTASEIGRLVGARYLIIGSFMDIGGEFRMTARIVDGETSEIFPRAVQVGGARDEIYRMLGQLADEVIERADLPPLPPEVIEQRRQSEEIPAEAVILFSRAQTYEDFGDRDRAVEVYQRIVSEFPQMTEARQALEQISGS